MTIDKIRCSWAKTPIEVAYHDDEWGIPLHDDRKLFEFLILEGAQAGLSWVTILKKREAYRRAFAEFEIEKVAHFQPARIELLLGNSGIIRNRLKVESAILNAKLSMIVQEEFGSLDAYLWQFVGGAPVRNHWESWECVPATSLESDLMSKDLKKRGFKFVGATICYALMQAAGMVNDHMISCFKYGVD
jgi:DNA-3-methyladenine glycosylase I